MSQKPTQLTALERAQFSLSFLNYALNCHAKDSVIDVDSWLENAKKIREFVFALPKTEIVELVTNNPSFNVKGVAEQ